MGREWKFAQLGGGKRTLTLAGSCAPHGRPRQRAVVSDGIKLRRQRVYYPDQRGIPTTHVFGYEWTDWELVGRFSDVHLGKGGTAEAIRQWQSVVADGYEVTISWGDIIRARGYVDSFTPGRESETECNYTIALLIDDQIGAVQAQQRLDPRPPPLALCQALQAKLDANVSVAQLGSLSPTAGALTPDFLDSLDSLVSSINGFSASLIAIAGDIDAFAEATLDQLERLRAGVAQTRTAVNRLRHTIETTNNDSAMFARAADNDAQWFASRVKQDVATMAILALLEELDREAELAIRGRILSVYTARLGDTWESIATLFYGGPEGAGRIRDANGVTYGALPVVGREYQIPVAK